MSSRLQLDVRNLSLVRRHLVNAYEVKAGIGVWGTTKMRYINIFTFTFTFRTPTSEDNTS